MRHHTEKLNRVFVDEYYGAFSYVYLYNNQIAADEAQKDELLKYKIWWSFVLMDISWAIAIEVNAWGNTT